MNNPSQDDDRSEYPAEPLQRVETTFQLAPAWQHLRHVPLGEFEDCDPVAVVNIRLEALPKGNDQNGNNK